MWPKTGLDTLVSTVVGRCLFSLNIHKQTDEHRRSQARFVKVSIKEGKRCAHVFFSTCDFRVFFLFVLSVHLAFCMRFPWHSNYSKFSCQRAGKASFFLCTLFLSFWWKTFCWNLMEALSHFSRQKHWENNSACEKRAATGCVQFHCCGFIFSLDHCGATSDACGLIFTVWLSDRCRFFSLLFFLTDIYIRMSVQMYFYACVIGCNSFLDLSAYGPWRNGSTFGSKEPASGFETHTYQCPHCYIHWDFPH